MHTPLTVRVDDGVTPRTVTRHVRGLSFRKTAPGGHHSASMRLNLPLDTFDDLGPADKVYIDDGRTGRTVWEGYPENPGREAGAAGEGFDLSAMGGMVLAADYSTPVVFIDQGLGGDMWIRAENVTPGATDAVVDNAQLLQFPSGMPVGTSSRVGMRYLGLKRNGQRLFSLECTLSAGKADAGYYTEVVTTVGPTDATGELAYSRIFDPSTATVSVQAGGAFPVGRDAVMLRIQRTGGATNVADDLTWGKFDFPTVRAILAAKDGSDATGVLPYNVRPHEVVEHLLGAMLPQFDGAGATVETTANGITQFAYHDGATPRQILDDLALYEPDMLWEVGETTAAGKHRFAYRAWPTTPRYEISVLDGFSQPGGDADLCNRVVVYWTDAMGQRAATIVTSTVPELGSRVRDAQPVTLPTGQGGANEAQQIGERVLAAKARPPRAARATVTRPLLDHLKGGPVMPWEIEPGYLVRVRETGDDLRLTEVTYSDESTSAALTLDEPQRTVEQMVAALAARR